MSGRGRQSSEKNRAGAVEGGGLMQVKMPKRRGTSVSMFCFLCFSCGGSK
jgi:hypothetical protein